VFQHDDLLHTGEKVPSSLSFFVHRSDALETGQSRRQMHHAV
jgi:hypothetical protein